MPRRETQPQLFAGRYQLEQELGRGGFGAVHRAWDTQAQRRVAVKIVDRRSLELAGGMHRFHREASVLMRLTHPNVVRAYDAGETEGTPYLVLELLEGVSLEVALRTRGPMPADRVAAITRDLLGALAEAHALGVVHRDVKPANVFLTAVDGQEGTRLLDFGIAKADGLDAAQTAMGATLGTAAYMAPEQITGGAVQPATDLFAVGLLMAEMIVGHRIYSGASGLAILVAKANGAPVEIPAAVKEGPFGPIVARAVQIDPERRFRSAPEMRALLDRADGVRVSSAPRASFASAPPRDSPLPILPQSEPKVQLAAQTTPSALDETAPQPRIRAESPPHAYVPVAISDTAASAMAPPGPTELREIGAAETATFEPLVVTTPPARRSRVGRVMLAIFALVLVAGAVATWTQWPTSKRKPRSTNAAGLDPEKPLVLEDKGFRKILPGDKAATMGGTTIGPGGGPTRASRDCPELEAMCADDLEARLRTLGKVTPSYRGERISDWAIPDASDEGGTKVTLYDLESLELAREVARRLRRTGPVLVAGKRVLGVANDVALASVHKAVCHP